MKTNIVIIFTIIFMLVFASCKFTIPEANTSKLPPQINSFAVNPSNIQSGQTAMVSWDIANATSVVIQPDLNNVPTSGSIETHPTRTTDYTILASNKYGTSTTTIKLSVTEPPPAIIAEPPMILSFTATPEEVWAGGVVVLNWEILNATSISLKSDHDDIYNIKDPFGHLILEAFLPTIFTLTAKNNFGASENQTTIVIRKDDSPVVIGGSGGGSPSGGGGGGGG